MNAVILTSVISAANSGMYASSRMLYSLAVQGYASKAFTKTTRTGVPLNAQIMTTVVGALTFIASIAGPKIYIWLVAASGLTGFIAWLGIALSHFRFRRAFIKQGHHISELKYHAKLFPIGPIFALILCLLIIVGQDLDAFTNFNWQQISITYLSVPIFIGLYSYYKIRYRTKLISLEKN